MGHTGHAGNLKGVRVAHTRYASNLKGVAWHGHSPAAYAAQPVGHSRNVAILRNAGTGAE